MSHLAGRGIAAYGGDRTPYEWLARSVSASAASPRGAMLLWMEGMLPMKP